MRMRSYHAVGIGVGNIVAALISWQLNHNVIWLIIHFCFSWLYVIYAAVVYYHFNLLGVFNSFILAIQNFLNAL